MTGGEVGWSVQISQEPRRSRSIDEAAAWGGLEQRLRGEGLEAMADDARAWERVSLTYA